MTPDETLKLTLIELCGADLAKAKEAFDWVNEPPAPVVAEPAPVEGGVGLTDSEVLNMSPAALKDAAMLRLAAKQNAGTEVSDRLGMEPFALTERS